MWGWQENCCYTDREPVVLFLEKNLKIHCSRLCDQKIWGEGVQSNDCTWGRAQRMLGWYETWSLNIWKWFTRIWCQVLKINSRYCSAGIANKIFLNMWDIRECGKSRENHRSDLKLTQKCKINCKRFRGIPLMKYMTGWVLEMMSHLKFVSRKEWDLVTSKIWVAGMEWELVTVQQQFVCLNYTSCLPGALSHK